MNGNNRRQPGDRQPNVRGRHDRGSVAVLFTLIVLIAVILVTFLVDAGAQLQAANRADTYSAEAARAATIGIGPTPTGGAPDAVAAATAARAFLAQTRVHARAPRLLGSVTVTGPATVAVSVTVTGSTPMLRIPVHQTRTHIARLLVGVTGGQGPA